MATITLKYQKNQSHEIRVEDLKIKTKSGKWFAQETPSFFMDEYKEAIEMVNAIIALCNGKKEKEEEKRNDSANKDRESINNRILFVGQRGTGKTSAMTSFAKGLDDAEKDGKKAFYFKCLPMIDPSNFDNNTNILLTVITMMFSEAKELMKENGNDEDIISKRERLLKQFDEVFKSLKAITGSEKPTFTLEGLNEKSRALQMRTGMHGLVKSYIDFYNEVKKTHLSRLVLLIDDIDMTVSHVPEMLEQLRKYLDLDNLLILMSANLGQLYNEMREHYSKSFKETLNDRNQALSIDVEDLANKYLLKLFPTSRRIRVEHLTEQLLESKLEMYGSNQNINTEKPKTSGELQNVVLSLIWKRTRLLFIPKDAKKMLHPIIPTNLRELMQFLDMLTSLEKVEYKGEKGDEVPRLFWNKDAFDHCEENVRKFKKYILHNWIPNHLSVEEELVFEHIPTDITEINKHLINAINMIGTNHKKDLMSREVGLDIIERNAENVYIDRDIYTMVSPNDPKFIKANKISDIFNQPSNYSYGDLLLMIDKYETYFESADDRKFTDAIKIYYSILLFETMFFAKKEVVYKKPNNPILDDLIIPIQQLIGGTVYYPNYFEIIKDKYFNQKGPSFDAKRAFYHKLPIDDEKGVGEDYPFYAILYYGDIRPDRYDTKHIYDTTFKNDANIDGQDFVTFDILSILSNMLNPWHTYFRADNRVKEESDEWKNKIEGCNENSGEGWRDFCEIKPVKVEKGNEKEGINKKFIPNSILPFYSVDMMLNYLKESYEVNKVVGFEKYQDNLYKKYEKIKSEGRCILFSLNAASNNELLNKFFDLLKELREIIIIEYLVSSINSLYSEKDDTLDNTLKLLNEKDIDTLKNTIEGLPVTNEVFKKYNYVANDSEYSKWERDRISLIQTTSSWIDKLKHSSTTSVKSIEELKILYKEGLPEKYCSDFEKYYDILKLVLEAKGTLLTNKPSDVFCKKVANIYLNEVISILLEKYIESQKERDTLIKELHKYSTPSEIFKHLVESLWDNKITEICIRSDIQKSVRKKDSVDRYYIELWKKTSKLLDIVGKDAIEIYLSVFNKAAGIFITDSSKHEELMEKAGQATA